MKRSPSLFHLLLLWLVAAMLLTCGCGHGMELDVDAFMTEARSLREADGGSRRLPALMHISDVHGRTALLRAALLPASSVADVVVNTGDDFNGTPGDAPVSLMDHARAYRAAVESFGLPVLGVQGNHDAFLGRTSYRRLMVEPMAASVAGLRLGDADGCGTYGYYDLATADEAAPAVRIILLDPRDSAAGDSLDWWHATFSQEQVTWLTATLDDARLRNLPVVTVMHYPFGDSPVWSHTEANPDIAFLQDPFMIPDIIDAMQRGQAMERTYTPRHPHAGAPVRVSVEASPHRLHFVAHLFGHIHSKETYWCSKSDGSHRYDMLMLGEASLSQPGTALDRVKRHPGTAEEMAASLLLIDTRSHTLHRVSFGAYLRSDAAPCGLTQSINYRRKASPPTRLSLP